MTRAVVQITNTGTEGTMGVTVPRRDGPALVLVPPGETADIDVTELVWPARQPDAQSGPPEAQAVVWRPRAEWFELVALGGPAAVLAGVVARDAGWVALAVLAVCWGAPWAVCYARVWRAAR